MERKLNTKLIEKREAFRLWFEYLKLAKQSQRIAVKDALRASRAFYEPWDDIANIKFDDWWKSHEHLFEERYIVRTLVAGELPVDPDALIIEIPLTLSPTDLLERVRVIIQTASEARERSNKKAKKAPSATYRLSIGSEPKLDAVREMLSVYRNVHLKNPKLRGEALLDATHKYYLGRKIKRWAKIPMALDVNPRLEDKVRAMRNLRRYIQKAENIMLNVAKGEFPGEY